jgi:Mg2+ and Co2+ transporter CorA
MNEGPPNPQLSPEFEEYYEKLNKQTSDLAYAILNQVSKNDVRLLKKISIRLTNIIDDIKQLN